MADISRRTVLKAVGLVGVAVLPQSRVAAAPKSPDTQPVTYLFLNSEEAAFVEAALSRLIPDDNQWPGAIKAGVPNYLDKQLAGAWGAGERLYRSGPWSQGSAPQGYQLPFTPAELFRNALRAINHNLEILKTPFHAMNGGAQDAYL